MQRDRFFFVRNTLKQIAFILKKTTYLFIQYHFLAKHSAFVQQLRHIILIQQLHVQLKYNFQEFQM